MERKINKKIENYLTKFKDSIRDKAREENNIDNLLKYIYEYDRLIVDKEDLANRKRIKNIVPFCDRCSSKRANNEQCTRRKKDGHEYCGTHIKGTPHGIINENGEIDVISTQKVEVWAQDIQGIIYYLDKNMNVYQTEDIVSNKPQPKIIAKYIKNDDTYHIPEFNI
jgi:hypothetical protein